MRVKAAPGHRVPLEDDPYKYIETAKAVDVPDTSYYRRRLAACELMLADKLGAGAKQPAKESAE
ncbi:DUF2635 domain-containing protein [Pseudomonas sp. WS 5059]|jgi:hypothetical protein|uniref:hypothetical protein n=1 Tax=Pseudomonas sp. WS 5059 TaxID=2717491 RepID=UPI001474B0DE|nr:hypothetical protein [Pseudomonas sp. WS 5059]NMY01466.1 DUF2635 domain-containing protein [Pseudomonas sp. WS 5059]